MPNKDRPLVYRHPPKNGVGWLMNTQWQKSAGSRTTCRLPTLNGSSSRPDRCGAVANLLSGECCAITPSKPGNPCSRPASGSVVSPGGDELPCHWLVLTKAVHSGLAISYVLALRDQGFRAVEPSCKPGPDFEACGRDKFIGGAGLLIRVVAAFAITGFACWFALSGRLNLAMIDLAGEWFVSGECT